MARLLWISLALMWCTSILQGQVVLRNSLSGNTKTLKQGGYATLSIPVSGPDISCGYRKLPCVAIGGYSRQSETGLLFRIETESLASDAILIFLPINKFLVREGLRPETAKPASL